MAGTAKTRATSSQRSGSKRSPSQAAAAKVAPAKPPAAKAATAKAATAAATAAKRALPVRPRDALLDRDALQLAALRAYHGFIRHRGLDSAAALSFYAALALFPASLSVVSAFALL